jgi:hypothetical protein
MRKAQSTLQALNIEIRDESVERGSPIVAPAGFLTSEAVTPVSREQGAA